jgi:essential nuclear protein 1
MPRAAAKPTGKSRHDPLLVQLREDEVAEKYGRVSQPGRRKKARNADADAEEGETAIDPKTSRKIFELARDQQVELGVLDEDESEDEEEEDGPKHRIPRVISGEVDEDEEEVEEYEVEEYEVDAEDEFVRPLEVTQMLHT